MLGTDAYGHGVVAAFEFPSQVAAVLLLLVAQLTRYVEVRAALPRPAVTVAAEPAPEQPALSIPLAQSLVVGGCAMLPESCS